MRWHSGQTGGLREGWKVGDVELDKSKTDAIFFFFSGKKSHKSKAARYDQNKLRENSTWSRV